MFDTEKHTLALFRSTVLFSQVCWRVYGEGLEEESAVCHLLYRFSSMDFTLNFRFLMPTSSWKKQIYFEGTNFASLEEDIAFTQTIIP